MRSYAPPACYTARQWVQEQDGDMKRQVEPCLAKLHSIDEAARRHSAHRARNWRGVCITAS